MTALVDLHGRLSLHPQLTVTVMAVGQDRTPVIVVDNFLSDPGILVDYAVSQAAFEGVADTSYPGVRAPLPPIYLFAVRALLAALIADTFGLRGNAVTGEFGYFSLVTTPPDRLSVLQRMPHIDDTHPSRLAALHYLCDAAHGGTSFYRQRRTGFEYVDESRRPAYRGAVVQDVAMHGEPPAAYICGDDAAYERTASIAATYNRLLIYRSLQLHSADIGPAFRFEADPRRGRLTANGFYYYR